MNNPQAFLKYLKTLNIQSHIQPHFSDLASKAKVALQKTPQLLPRKSGEAHKPPHHYRPTLYLSHPFFQVLYNISEPRKSLTYERERLFFEDGGHVCLDWASSLRLRNKQYEEYQPEDNAPIFFVMHGLTGGSEMNYIKVLVDEARKNGFRSVCMNSRGICSQMTSPIPFTALDFHELQDALTLIEKRYPRAPIYMVGTSFGANYLARYLLRSNRPSVKGFVGLAAPFNVNSVVSDMGPVYQKFFVKRYIEETVKKHPQMKYWENIGLVKMSEVFKAKNLSEFHNSITVRIVKEKDADSLFKRYSIGPEIGDLRIPSLFMNSKDDPIVSCSSIPEELKTNKNVEFMLTESGGHVCWYQGIIPNRWYPKPTLNFIKKLLNH